ncbi:uncharacterized protein LOC119267162 isoform X2 [Triticum dicoccoides]|uniref:uncharacterized protein LOC119267162 isoform X2 n=1 Tax=Triticum dicoccoides TaxID=85692 RepID=UPI001890B26D|nr:uncharacterized protein LOC119267162 isoform X2 [Triticum dicoccoides]XP_044338950.1 uncharacterized protein LOC123060333 isoform X2 [Triticum aestivum]
MQKLQAAHPHDSFRCMNGYSHKSWHLVTHRKHYKIVKEVSRHNTSFACLLPAKDDSLRKVITKVSVQKLPLLKNSLSYVFFHCYCLVVDKIHIKMDDFLEDGSQEATILVIQALAIAVPHSTDRLYQHYN